MTISFDSNLLLSLYQSKTAGLGTTAAATGGTVKKKVAPTAPWSQQTTPAQTSAAVRSAMLGHKLVDENAAKLDLAGASTDYKKLFALYQGLGTLSGVAEQMNAKTLSSAEKARIQSVFAKGMSEIASYVDDLKLDQLRLTQGDVADRARSKVGAPKPLADYVTDPLVSGSSSAEVPALQGAVQFKISVKRVNTVTDVPIDLGQMGSTPRTLGNVVTYINDQLKAAGVLSRVATQRIPGQPQTTTIGGKTVTLSTAPDQWALKIKVDSGETMSFSAPATANSIYMAQGVGDPDPDKKPSSNDGVVKQQLLKFQTDTSAVPAPLQKQGEANWVDGRVFAETLGPEVKTVRATKVGPDGSVYMLADITAKSAGQEIKGDQDVALLKYDSAGKLIYTRTLGASDEASGLGLAVSADGKVAVAGSLTGDLGGAQNGALNSGATGSFAEHTDSFVTLYDKDGQEVWTERRGARLDDEASQLAFGADGAVYVAGRSKSALPNGTALGGWDGYVEAFKADTTGKVQTLFTQSYGTAGDDRPAGLVVDGTSVVVAGVEGSNAVLRRYDLSGGTPVLAATQSLGDLKGGDIAGLALDGGQLVIAGTTTNAALSGTIKQGHSGGSDVFAAKIAADLSGGATIAYYGGTGDDRATSVAASGGTVWIAGAAGADLPNAPAVGKKDGFLVGLDVAQGSVTWSRRFTGKDGYAAPSAIAVDPQGASVLDRLGLPKGTLSMKDSQRITAQSSVRAGDQFTIKVGSGVAKTITIDEAETMDTLATKIKRATGFQAKVEIVTADGARKLQIKPLNERTVIEIGPGKGDRDALEMLGLPEGVVRATRMVDGKTVPGDGKGQIYGLGLPSDLNLSDTEQVKHALAELAAAQGVIRNAYKDLVTAASPQSALSKAAAAGPAPAYLTNQLANYQAALERLGGG